MINNAESSHDFSRFVTKNEAGHYTLICSIEGVQCASCIQVVENGLESHPDVVAARVNMSTQRLTFSWQGDIEQANTLSASVVELGYPLKPFSADDVKQSSLERTQFLLRCIAVSGFAMGNLMMISVGLWSSNSEIMGIMTQDLLHGISVLIALPAILYAGRPFFYSALSVLKEGHTNMDVPISLAVILASGMSLVETLSQGDHIYFDSAVMLLFFLLIGRYLDERAKGKARESAKQLLSMMHGVATVVRQGETSQVAIRDLREDMVVMVAVGENIPADGVVLSGESDVDMSLISGETLPRHVTHGEKVFAGTINLLAPLHVTISKASENSLLSDIVSLMEKAEQGQAHYVRVADKAAKLYTPVVHSLGLLTFLGWWLIMEAGWQASLLNAITVLIITCPCALGLAVPVVQVLASGRLMKQGILLKSGNALEKLANIDTVVFDKTGTLTSGEPQLIEDYCSSEHMQLAASLAAHSKHPLSQAVVKDFSGTLLTVDEVQELPGRGLVGAVGGQQIQLGSRDWCGDNTGKQQADLELWLAIGNHPPQRLLFSDQLRNDAKSIVERLQDYGLDTCLLSGDQKGTVEKIANKVGIKDYHSALSPVDKYQYLEALKLKGHHVLMVGDGINDAPSLAAAQVSMSPSTAMDITQNAADIVFQGKKLMPVIESWQVSLRANTLVRQNFMLAVAYNVVAIPLAVVGYVTPLIAAIAMSGSSLVVIANSFRLTRRNK